MKRFHLGIFIWFAFLAYGFLINEPAAAKTESVESPTPSEPAPNGFADQIYVDRNSRVGIGTKEPAAAFDVYHGEIKIGSSGIPCSAALAGAIRYADAKLQLCNGAVWRNVSLDKTQ